MRTRSSYSGRCRSLKSFASAGFEVLGAAYEARQRHGLSIEQLFEPNLRFFVARLGGLAVGCGGVAMFDDYAEVKRVYTRPAARGRGVAKAPLRKIEEEAR